MIQQVGQEQKPRGRLLGPTLTTSSPHKLWAESAFSPNEIISSLVMGLSVTGTPAAPPPSDTKVLCFEIRPGFMIQAAISSANLQPNFSPELLPECEF